MNQTKIEKSNGDVACFKKWHLGSMFSKMKRISRCHVNPWTLQRHQASVAQDFTHKAHNPEMDSRLVMKPISRRVMLVLKQINRY